tara:strand:- start:444 stop:2189 length:1746 start_codon:yes stop_codon:yes gene_type:complete
MAINRTKQARQMLNNAGAVEQDGVMNYIKNSESVTVPKEFKARGNAPSTKLAYITADEAKMLKKEKPGTPHKGPKGIPSYDSFDAQGGFTSGAAMSAAETGSSNARDRAEINAAFGPKGLPPGVTPNEAKDLRSAAILAGAGRRVNPGFFDSRNVISPSEIAAARAFAKDRNNRFARAALRNRQGGLLGLITSGGLLGNLIRGLGQKFGLGKTFNQPTYDMSKFNELGLMGQVPEDFEDEKISLTSFIKPEDTIGRVNLNDLEGLTKLDFIGRKNLNDYEGILEDKGLRIAPGAIIDEGLLEVPADLIDQGLLEVPADLIDQGEIIALANGGRINAMDGGLMNLDGARQMMFIGGVVKAGKKAVKKITRGVKKIAKSPLGKAALLGAGLYFTRGTGGGILEKFSNLKPFQKALFGIGATSALAGLTTPKEEDEEIDLEEYYRQAMINPNAPLSRRILGTEFAANGGRIGYAEGSKEPVAKKVMPLLDMGGMEKDYRADGGFVPIGRMEKADDVPARLSKNEFVFTADAVRNAGGGDVDKGSEVMYNMMKNLEAGGKISEESQGLEGAREMFQTSQRLGEVI